MIFEIARKVSKVLRKVLRGVVFAMTAVMVCTVLLQVFCRFIFHTSIQWTEEMARTFFVYIIFLGVPLVEESDSQTRITFIRDRFPKPVQFVLCTIINICEFAFLLFVFIGTIQVWDTAAQIKYIALPTVTYRVLYIPFLIGLPLAMWFVLCHQLELVRSFFFAEKHPEPVVKRTVAEEKPRDTGAEFQHMDIDIDL